MPVSLKGNELIIGAQLDSVRAMDGRDRLAHLRAHDPFERRFPGEGRGDLDTQLGQGRCHLAADESHPDDHRAPTSSGLPLDGLALCDRPQLVDPAQLGPGDL